MISALTENVHCPVYHHMLILGNKYSCLEEIKAFVFILGLDMSIKEW